MKQYLSLSVLRRCLRQKKSIGFSTHDGRNCVGHGDWRDYL